MQTDLHGKRALVTGSSSGIGFHVAAMLAEAGTAHVVINGRNPDRGEAARIAICEHSPRAKITFIAADLAAAGGARALVDAAGQKLGGAIDILVNCAGGDHTPRLFREACVEEIESVMRHWLLGTLYCCHYALPLMPDGSAIVNVASDAAKVPTPGESVIGAAMAGIAMFSRTLAMEAKRQKIRVNVVTPSLVRSTLSHERLMAGPGHQRERRHISRLKAMDLCLTPEQEQIRDSVRKLCAPFDATYWL